METTRRPANELLDVVRVLLLVQGAILIATTIEALIWSLVFPGAAGVPVLMSGAAAAVVLVARARLRAGRSWARRFVYGVEILILVSLAIDIALAVALTGALPPVVALLTRLALPLAVIALLRRSERATLARVPPVAVTPLEVAS